MNRDADRLGKFTKMYEVANALAQDIRRVHDEDAEWLAKGGLAFDLVCILGGQMEDDDKHRLYLIYPEGNWVQVGVDTPYVIIGKSRYGKPLLDRVWRYGSSLDNALCDGLLSFDATRTSSATVDYPADVVLYRRGTYTMVEHRFSHDDLQPLADHWMSAIRNAVDEASAFVPPLLASLPDSPTHRRTVGFT